MDQMPTDQRIALISDAVNYLVGNTDSESQKCCRIMVKAVHDPKISKMASSSSSSGPALLIWLNYLAKHVEEASPADAAMGDATTDSPAKVDDPNRVSLSESYNDIDPDK